MKTLGNILWHFPFFGFITATLTWLLGGLLTLTVIAAPVGLGLMEYGKLLFWPFGNAMVSKSQLNTEQNKAWKTYSTIVTILYFPFGLFLTICAIFQIIVLSLSIIGIPAAIVVAKSLSTYLNPVNKKCVHGAVVAELERRKAQEQIDKHLGNKFTAQTHSFAQQEVLSNPKPIIIEKHVITTNNFQSSKSETAVDENPAFNISEWFSLNKKKVFIGVGGLVGVLLIIMAVKFVINLDFKKLKGNTEKSQSNQPTYQASEDQNLSQNNTNSLSEKEVMSFLNEWLNSQNTKNLGTYSSYYSENFRGIKRTKSGNTYYLNQTEWLRDRTKMYTTSKNLNISISNIKINTNTDNAIAHFTQNYSSNAYSDIGQKIIKVVKKGDGKIYIESEELINSVPN